MKTTVGAVALAAVLATGGIGAAMIAALPATGSVAASNATLLPAAEPAPARAPALRPWPVLKQGPNAAWPKVTVRTLQYLLTANGARLPVTGTFAAQTKAAVIAFQKAHQLTADGVAGAATWRALLSTLHEGSTGPAARAVQDQINFRNTKNGHTLNVDGIYGPKTRAAVRAFQEAMAHEIKGFPVDGIIGPLTWQALVTEALSG